MRRRTLLWAAIAVAIAACGPAPQPTLVTASVAPSPAIARTGPISPPVDDGLEPVSLTHLSAGAKEALTLCVREGEIGLVAGMAELASARDVPRYGWFFGKPPELQTDAPAWVVQFAGDVPGRYGTDHDPTCVVINGVRTVFGTGGHTNLDGKRQARSDMARAPDLALPPLLP